eukprot:CFRG7228T1
MQLWERWENFRQTVREYLPDFQRLFREARTDIEETQIHNSAFHWDTLEQKEPKRTYEETLRFEQSAVVQFLGLRSFRRLVQCIMS